MSRGRVGGGECVGGLCMHSEVCDKLICPTQFKCLMGCYASVVLSSLA